MSQVTAPGYYPDIDESTYHADPAPRPSLSSSIATILVNDTAAEAKHAHPRLTPFESLSQWEQEARTKKEREKGFDMGNVAHKLVLGKGKTLSVLPFDDYKKKAAQDARDEAFALGLQPCLEKVFDQGQFMAEAAFRQIAQDPDNFDAFDPAAGQSEVVALWQEQTAPGKMWMRIMCDRLMNDRRRLFDYKTFAPGADAEGFVKYLVREAREIQDPFYSRGVAAIEGCAWDEITFRFIVQSPKPPFLLSVIELDPLDRQWAYERSQWAIDKWAACAKTQVYRGFAPRTHYVRVPSWAQLAWEDRKQSDLMADRAVAPVAEAAE